MDHPVYSHVCVKIFLSLRSMRFYVLLVVHSECVRYVGVAGKNIWL